MVMSPSIFILTFVTFVNGQSNLVKNSQISASSYYNIAPYETSYLPSNVADENPNTAWASLGDKCDAYIEFLFNESKSVETICAQSRDMVDDPNVEHTDDSVIESYSVHADGLKIKDCSLPDWRNVYCCSFDSIVEAQTIRLHTEKCRERDNGPGNTGFKTVRILSPVKHENVTVTDAKVIGNDDYM